MKVRIDMIHALYRSLGSLRAWVTVIIGAASPGHSLPGALAGGSHRSSSGPHSLLRGAASSSLSYRKHALPLLALLAAAALGLWLLLPGGALYAQSSSSVEFAENGEGAVATFTATDPEDDEITWSLTGDDSADFAISDDGVLTFATSPNYEAPADADTDNIYEVTVTATDDDGTPLEGTHDVMIEVTNVEEAATVRIELSSLQPQVSTEIDVSYVDSAGNPFVDVAGAAYTGIVDDDRDKDDASSTAIPAEDVSWQWSRSSSKSGRYTDIPGDAAKTVPYTPGSSDRGMYLRVTGTYEDGEGEGKVVEATSAYSVRAVGSNSPPAFPLDFDPQTDGDNPPAAEIDDGATAGAAVGDPITASDANNDRLTYSLTADSSGTALHADFFQIDRETGQVTVGLGKTVHPSSDSGETASAAVVVGDSFTFTITATDPSGEESTVTMTVTVDAEDEAPVFTDGEAAHTFEEIPVGTTSPDLAVYTFEATDVEGDTVTYAMSGADASKFTLTGGALSFQAAPDFESPGSADGDNVYEVTITAASGTGATVNRTPLDVTVTVTNVDDPGTITLSATQPRQGTALTATAPSDTDGGVSGVTWKWESAASDNSDFSDATAITEIDGATSASYTPVAGDVSRFLRATASYTDAHGSDKSASAISTQAVVAAYNLAPVFTDEDDDTDGTQLEPREVPENSAEDTNVGAAIPATDEDDAETNDNNALVFTLSGADAGLFDIASPTGQITVAEGAQLDHETKDTYTVTITVRDLQGLNSSIDLTINVGDVNEAPMVIRGGLAIRGPSSTSYAENTPVTTPAATYTLVGPNMASGVWTLGGDDAGDFTFTGGMLAFAASPDYEAPADADRDNVYEVTLSADDSTYQAERDVTITVTNVDEDGALTLSSETPVVDVALTATLADPDGPTNVAWQWALEQADGTYVDIDMATSDTYTPVATDESFHLRVTVTYDDGHGAGKSLPEMITANAVIAGDPLVVRYDTNPKNNEIDKAEVIAGIEDFLFGTGNQSLEKADVIKLIEYFLFGIP